jgi:hypothetical protein
VIAREAIVPLYLVVCVECVGWKGGGEEEAQVGRGIVDVSRGVNKVDVKEEKDSFDRGASFE